MISDSEKLTKGAQHSCRLIEGV